MTSIEIVAQRKALLLAATSDIEEDTVDAIMAEDGATVIPWIDTLDTSHYYHS
ncbi:hypothetical protein [Haladaptatus salinisoli]|uniref:hypothetical protein n=1 Tax=Haladaptatus salinisoli TaxID=2884876 RepID=UPI001D0BB3C6|nr:hypothetical protein [Haladaptatus salinisoli]